MEPSIDNKTPEGPNNTQQSNGQAYQTANVVTPQLQNTDYQPEEKPLNKTDRLKRSFFHVLIGCLIGAASIAVIAVLFGSFNEILARALGTIAMVALHSLLSFSYINETEKRNMKDGGRTIEFFSNTVFTLITISFITSLLAIWQLLGGELTLKLYLMYGVLLFATLHADVLYRIRGFEKKLDNTIDFNYFFMSIVVFMLSLVIFYPDPSDLSDFFYRLLAAVGIVDATLTMTAIIMHKLYLQKHPELTVENSDGTAKSRSMLRNPFVVLLLVFLAFQVIGSLFALVLRGF